MTKYIDLHVHSNESDGTFSPTALVEKGLQNNLWAFALTDHDTVSGIPEALLAARDHPIQVIPGTELSAAYKNKDIHILGLFIDYKDPIFCKVLEEAQIEREFRNIKMVQNLAKAGININIDKLHKEDKNAVLTRAHFAKYLTKYQYTKTMKEAFSKYLDISSPYYVPRTYMSPEFAINAIRNAGGIPVLAHPLLYKIPPHELEDLISQLATLGLMGLEAIHSSNINNDESYLRGLARKYNLLITGGSDFHGANKPLIDMGTGKGNLKIPFSILDELTKSL
jgi:3',5'-nucleoside bisphosphate phosphatase